MADSYNSSQGSSMDFEADSPQLGSAEVSQEKKFRLVVYSHHTIRLIKFHFHVGTEEFNEEQSSKDYKLEFSDDEASLVARMFRLVGRRWSLIAGRIPGRTPEEVEKYWISRYPTVNSE